MSYSRSLSISMSFSLWLCASINRIDKTVYNIYLFLFYRSPGPIKTTTMTCTWLAVTLHGGKYRRRYDVSRLVEVRAYCPPPSACQHHITEDARQRWSSGTWNGAILYPIINVLCRHDVLIPESRHGVYRPAVLNSTPYGIVKKHEKKYDKKQPK